MTKNRIQLKASLLLGGAGVMAALLSAGCGGGSTAKTSATPAGPAAYGVGSPGGEVFGGSATGLEVSGLGLPANAATPTAGDVPYITTATAITPLGSTPPPVVDPTALVGTSYVYGDGTLASAAPAGQAGVTFRAEVSNGQLATGGLVAISSVVLTSTDPEWTLGSLPLTVKYASSTAATDGPFFLATESTAPFTLPFTTSGAHTVSVTVTDAAGQSTRTDYTIQVVAATEVALTINTIDTGAVDTDGNAVLYTLQPDDTATITGGDGATATADESGVALLYSTPGTQTLTVNGVDSAGAAVTYTQTLDLTTSAGGTYAQSKKRASFKALKARTAAKVRH